MWVSEAGDTWHRKMDYILLHYSTQKETNHCEYLRRVGLSIQVPSITNVSDKYDYITLECLSHVIQNDPNTHTCYIYISRVLAK